MRSGFTLAELLIALAILGVIATFAIPKVLQAQQDGKFKSIAKEAAGTISAAYDAYRLHHQPDEDTETSDLTPYMNYVRLETSADVDHTQGSDVITCSDTSPKCLILHNGAILHFYASNHFDGTETTNAIQFRLDPDGKYSGSTTGPGKSVLFFLYFNGRLASRGTVAPNTYSSDGGPYSDCASCDPPWFGWD